MYKLILVAVMLTATPTLADSKFSGKSCITMPNGIEDCVTSQNHEEFERLKTDQASRYEKAMEAILEDKASDDKLLRQMLDVLKESEQK